MVNCLPRYFHNPYTIGHYTAQIDPSVPVAEIDNQQLLLKYAPFRLFQSAQLLRCNSLLHPAGLLPACLAHSRHKGDLFSLYQDSELNTLSSFWGPPPFAISE
jgi:hypothetical protein